MGNGADRMGPFNLRNGKAATVISTIALPGLPRVRRGESRSRRSVVDPGFLKKLGIRRANQRARESGIAELGTFFLQKKKGGI